MIFKQNGFTFYEMIFVLAIASIACFVIADLLIAQKKATEKFDRADTVRSLIIENINEIKAQHATQVMPVNKCRLRVYDKKGDLDSDTWPTQNLSDTASECQPAPVANKIHIIWTIKDPDPGTYAFNPSHSLQLPTLVSSIRQIEVRGRTIDASGKTFEKFLVILKESL